MAELLAAKRVGFLSVLSDDDLHDLVANAQRVLFRKDQEILVQGQRNDSLFVVEEGLLHARRFGGGREVFLGRLEAGSFFGELSLFDPGPTAAAVHGVSDGVLLQISRTCLDQFLARHPAAGSQILLGILRDVAHRLRRADERLTDSVVWGSLLRDHGR